VARAVPQSVCGECAGSVGPAARQREARPPAEFGIGRLDSSGEDKEEERACAVEAASWRRRAASSAGEARSLGEKEFEGECSKDGYLVGKILKRGPFFRPGSDFIFKSSIN